LAILTKTVFDDPIGTNVGYIILIAILFFAIQLYCDFSGCMDIVIGTSELFDINLNENFNSPYFSRNIQEFWQRWHVTLNKWFVDYIYISLGGSKKGEIRKYINILIIFFISGLWHGANYNFIIWGLLNGIAIIIYNIWKKSNIKINKFIAIFTTFTFTNFSWVIFANNNFNNLKLIFKNLFINNFKFTFGRNGITEIIEEKQLYVAIVSIVILWSVERGGDIKKIREKIGKQNVIVRWIL
jgi:D-alanyl-lipoteichoic acid acyltransferase DltB (MBOAT superfamily)